MSFFITPGVTPTVDDVDITNVQVGGQPFTLIPGYPIVDGPNLVFYYGLSETLPYDFGTTTGTIQIFWIGRVPDVMQMSVRLTSGVPTV